ncbi:PorP/SprF family type IX secretion system membrane protein [Chitinophaga sp. Cy-1792]|uniref:PorP/SprF family type IX secretion system membrane protein n=1 Tax=Chitinophaga sp. Cy-1792 TaxID=2608339 RepID=UPI0014223AA5|nr:PorP/SprF family type IX secretion system membrane protein [Chitinophaga sp. Cy-1792]NIG54647.1 type IX secretion system membrane protein PorP/SprF [Chitinophaga sp. Cy-1792]
MKPIRFLVLFCCLLSTRLVAQDPHFSQYFTSPMTLNPALTGNKVDDWRLALNARSQWWGDAIKPYYTVTASLEKSFTTGNSNLGIGGSVLSDQSNGGILKNNYFSFSAAYHLALDPAAHHLLSAGLTGTYANRILDASKFLYQSQLGSMGFQRDLPANDAVNLQKNSYLDVSAGMSYSYNNEHYGLSAGAALFHVAKPKEGAYNSMEYNIPRKVNAQLGGWINTGGNNELHVSSIAEFQGGNSIYTLGGVYKIGMDDGLLHSINLGLWERFGDALYPYFGIETARWMAGITYDYVQSGLKNYQSVQSMELSFVWQFGKRNTSGTRSGVLNY